MHPQTPRRRRALRESAPLAALSLSLLLLFCSPLVRAGPREDREAAAAAAAKASASSPAPSPSPSASSALGSGAPKNASFLFTITARKAELSPDPKRNDSAILKLIDANPHVLWFADKPSRAAGALDAVLFLSRAFAPNNGTGPWLGEPNAVVLGMGPGGGGRGKRTDDEAAVVTLRDPSIDSRGVITFRAEVIKPAGADAEAEEAAEGTEEEQQQQEQRRKRKEKAERERNSKVSSDVARNYLKAGERREGEGEGAPAKTHLLESPPAKKITWENVQLFIDDYYLEEPAAAAAPSPPPPTVVVIQAPPPPPPPPPPPAAPTSSYESSLWNRIDGPQPIDAYGCGFSGGCGYGGFGYGGFGR